MNTIFIHDMRVDTKIGVYAWERELPQTLRLDLELELPSSRPFETGELADAIDYAAVVAHVRGVRRATIRIRCSSASPRRSRAPFSTNSVRRRSSCASRSSGPLPGVRELGVAIERRADSKS